MVSKIFCSGALSPWDPTLAAFPSHSIRVGKPDNLLLKVFFFFLCIYLYEQYGQQLLNPGFWPWSSANDPLIPLLKESEVTDVKIGSVMRTCKSGTLTYLKPFASNLDNTLEDCMYKRCHVHVDADIGSGTYVMGEWDENNWMCSLILHIQ